MLTFRAKDGKVAIYDSTADDLPFDDPVNHMDRVKFHSDLDYINIIATISGSVTFPQRTAPSVGAYITTFQNGPAHGISGIPLIFGYLTLGGQNVAFAGSVPIQGGGSGSHTRFVSLGASPTNIVFNELVNIGFGGTIPAITVPYTVFVTDEILI